MTPDNKKKPEDEKPQKPFPSTGEGADSALDVLRKRRGQVPPADPTLPPVRPPPKA